MEEEEEATFFDVRAVVDDDKPSTAMKREADVCVQQVTQTHTFAPHPHDLGRLIPEFSEGDGVAKWLRRIDHFRILYGWTEQMCLLYGTTRLSGAAASWYRRYEEKIFNWTQFKQHLIVAFPETFDEADIHRQLEEMRKERDESYESFVYRVDALAQQGDFSTSATLKYIIKGLRNDPVYPSLLARQYVSTLDLLQHIKWISSNLSMISARNSSATLRISKTTTMGSGASFSGGETVCFNCRETGHRSIDCPKPQRRERCSKCMKVGHTAEKCTVVTNSSKQFETNQIPTRTVGRNSVNAVFGGDDVLEMDGSSLVEVDVEAAGERFRTMALVDTDE